MTEITARNRDTGDTVYVKRDPFNGYLFHKINGGPFQEIPPHLNGTDLSALAFNILREHIAQRQSTETEELTLP